ncbi:MAG: DUF1553 domain-containing protein [Capsulimonadales bacterium]|nr:DUF1553 domain-containing protein [Capsulimonadales bacterium]
MMNLGGVTTHRGEGDGTEMRWYRVANATAAGAAILLALMAAGRTPAAPPVSSGRENALFETKVRPLLLSSCVSCHGKEHPQGGLRLDAPVTIAQAEEMLRRVRGEGGKTRMPPGGALPADKIATLAHWVRTGAKWPAGKTIPVETLAEKGRQHRVFQPLRRPSVPPVRAKTSVRNPIDAFVLRRLEAKGMTLSPNASRPELIRRLSYDLTGLPPTPEEVAAFVADPAPDAYARLVDRLLASPHYGEKWARHWLDLVRYAETNSYERDNPKPHAYKYRDYVIRSFNEDLPFDRFIREQIAGDELPGGNEAALVATGYYRLGIWDDEPADVKQAEFDDLDDLVTTTGQTFLGLTLDCARCHDHKLDPISQQDYYRFVSFFRNVNRFRNGGPTDEAVYFATEARKKEYEARAAALAAKRAENERLLREITTAHRLERARAMRADDLTDVVYRYYEGTWPGIPDFDALKPTATGTLNPGFLDLRPRKREENYGFVFEGTLNIPRDGEYTFHLDTDDGSRLRINGQKTLETTAPSGPDTERKAEVRLAAGRVSFRLEYQQAVGPAGISLAWSGPGFARRSLSAPESVAPASLPAIESAEIPLLLGAEKAKRYAELIKERDELAKQDAAPDRVLVVTESGPTAPETFVLERGDPTAPRAKVEPGFPVCIGGGTATVAPPSGAKSAGRRTALAHWLASPDNPLTARVFVNRLWQHHFGRGIVRTPNDFGLQGAPPTHPELLDWLAAEFIRQGWSIKAMHRLILNSNTYRQSARGTTVARARDPENDLFGRFEPRRLTAEEIRDSLLAVAGNLNPILYGPSVYPEIPKDILAGQSIPGAGWHTDRMTPEDRNRRSIYIHVKRSLIYPLLASFDLPETDRTSPFRFASVQPTQALAMMNGDLTHRQAAVLAGRVAKEAGTEGTAFARRLLSLVLQRPPTGAQIAESVALMERLKRRGANEERARHYLALTALNLNEFFYVD